MEGRETLPDEMVLMVIDSSRQRKKKIEGTYFLGGGILATEFSRRCLWEKVLGREVFVRERRLCGKLLWLSESILSGT